MAPIVDTLMTIKKKLMTNRLKNSILLTFKDKNHNYLKAFS